MQKLLTIVVPTYNMQDYLNRCLDSLVVSSELMQQLEVLVINDGSKDNSSAIAHEYEARYPETFRVIDKENGNYGSCVNRGLAEAEGKYIKILDADDWFDVAEFERFFFKLGDVDVDLVLTPFETVDDKGEVLSVRRQDLEEGACFDFNSFPQERISRYSMHMVTYRTELLRSVGYRQTEGISYTDTEWTHIPQYSIGKFVYYPYVVYKYFMGREGQTMDPSVLSLNIWKYETIIHSLVDNRKLYDFKQKMLADELNLQQIVFLATNIYRMFLVLVKPSSSDLAHLKEFDGYLKEACLTAYTATDILPLKKNIPIRYVSFWRRTGRRLSMDGLRDLHRKVKTMMRIEK